MLVPGVPAGLEVNGEVVCIGAVGAGGIRAVDIHTIMGVAFLEGYIGGGTKDTVTSRDGFRPVSAVVGVNKHFEFAAGSVSGLVEGTYSQFGGFAIGVYMNGSGFICGFGNVSRYGGVIFVVVAGGNRCDEGAAHDDDDQQERGDADQALRVLFHNIFLLLSKAASARFQRGIDILPGGEQYANTRHRCFLWPGFRPHLWKT